ncbi:MAG: DMT family transporter [Tunicatimonas sp.]
MLTKVRRNPAALAWGLLLLLGLVWGSSFILIKQGLTAFSAAEVGALRIASASVFLVPVALPALRTLSRRHLKLLAFIGLFGSLGPAFLFAFAQTQLSSSVTGILNAVTPLNVLLLGAAFFGRRITRPELVGLGAGLVGTVILMLAGSSGSLGGINYYALLIIAATICYGFNTNIIKNYLGDLKPTVITAVSLLLAGPPAVIYLFGASDFIEKVVSGTVGWPLTAIVLLGVLGTALALIMFNKLVQIRTAVFASSVTYLVPMVAIGWGVLDGESLSVWHLVGMGAILGGVYVANR